MLKKKKKKAFERRVGDAAMYDIYFIFIIIII